MRLRTLLHCAAAAALGSATLATAGNALNPAPINPTTAARRIDPDGMGTRAPAARSPAGRLYDLPVDPGEEEEGAAEGWSGAGFVELGGIHAGGDHRAQGFRTYKDVKSGLYLNAFGFSGERPDQARFLEAAGGAAGRDDQFYRARFGRYNDWTVAAFYDGTPQVFTTTYRSLWNGLGSGAPTLAALPPGGTTNPATTQAALQAALAAAPESSLEAVRRKAGVQFDLRLSELWKIYAGFSHEKREGARPFGAVFGGGGGGGNLEIAESIDHSTRDFVAGLQYADPVSSFNLRAAASFFRNGLDTMRFDNPLYVNLNGTTGLTPSAFTHGTFALAPDNQHYNVKGEYARALPDFLRGRFTATVAFGWMRQDDDLVPPTDYPLTGGSVAAGGVPLDQAWNTTDALGRQSAEARLDTRLVDLALLLRPANGLDLKGKVRYYETDNATRYLACNPLTGQWGRLLNDGSGLSLVGAHTGAGVNPPGTSANAFNAAGCDLAAARALGLVPSAGNIPIGAVPDDYRQLTTSVSADYRLGRARSANAALERERFRRAYREREDTWEDKVKLGYVDRGLIDGTLRLTYEHGRLRGSRYRPNPYQGLRSASLGPLPEAAGASVPTWFQSIDQFRSFDLADRDQDQLTARLDYAVHANVDAAVTLRLKDAEYPARYGRTGHHRNDTLTLDLSYRSETSALLYGFYSYQSGKMEQRGIHPAACVIGNAGVTAGNWMALCGAASAASPLFPESRAWGVASRDRNHVVGFGLKHDFPRASLDASFTRALGRTRIGYSYDATALGLSEAQAALAGRGLADLTLAQNVLDASLVVPLRANLLLRLVVRHESGRLRDWHYDGVASNPMPAANALYLDAGPQDYRATLLGLMFHVRL